LYTLGTVALHP